MISIVIPTKNRSNDLGKALASILCQTRRPEEVILVDQSDSDDALRMTETLFFGTNIRLHYIHDRQIAGLVDAKQIGVSHATGDFIFFLEDDIILEADYIERLLEGFTKNPQMIGCSGIITNCPRTSRLRNLLFEVFHRSIFFDPRGAIYRQSNDRENDLIPSTKLSGGVSAWRREVFSFVQFDMLNGFHMYEDIDFSTRVARSFGGGLYINPNARLAHYYSPLNRGTRADRQRRKVAESILYYKKRSGTVGASLGLVWLLVGVGLESLAESFSDRSFDPLRGYFNGLAVGIAKTVSIDGSEK